MALEELIGGEAISNISGKEFGIDPNIKYDPNSKDNKEEFAQRAGDLFSLTNLNKKLVQNGSDLEAIKGITGIAVKYMAGYPEDNEKMLRDPHLALEQSEVLIDSGYKNMTKFMENNLNVIIKEVNLKDLAQFAMVIPDKEKKYLKINEMIQTDNEEGLREEYAKLFPNSKLWQEYIRKQAPSNVVKYYASRNAAESQRKFAEKNLFGNDGSYESEKTLNYVTNTIGSYKGKDKQEALINLAAIYTGKLQSKK